VVEEPVVVVVETVIEGPPPVEVVVEPEVEPEEVDVIEEKEAPRVDPEEVIKQRKMRAIRKQPPPQPILDFSSQRAAEDFHFDAVDPASNALLTWLLQFCILTEEKKAKFKQVFVFFDADKDERLSVSEVSSVNFVNRLIVCRCPVRLTSSTRT
jgi:hypothetical protein